MAWTFIAQLSTERPPGGAYLYRMSITDGSETRTEYYKSPVALSGAEQIAAKNAVLFRMNNPPPQPTTLKQINQKILDIDAADAGTTNAVKAAKWDAVLAYRATLVGVTP